MAIDKVRIAHLYPNELNLYGDGGNVLCLYNRLVWRGYSCEVSHINMGDRITDFDILFIGGGQDREMKIISKDLKRKSDMLSYCVREGKVILAICGGYQLLGDFYRTYEGEEIKLTSALPFYTVGSQERMIGNFVYDTSFGKVVGFENHSGKTYLSKKLSPLGTIIKGFGNNGEDKTEGVLYKNTFATYAHGPVLPKNPAFADELIKRVTGEQELKSLDDREENLCHANLIKRFESINK